MGKRIGRGFLWALVGYFVGAFVAYVLTMGLSTNTHDKVLEAAMTAVFVAGPFFALLSFVGGVLRRR